MRDQYWALYTLWCICRLCREACKTSRHIGIVECDHGGVSGDNASPRANEVMQLVLIRAPLEITEI